MKVLSLIFALLFALPVMAISRDHLDNLLIEKGSSLSVLERQGGRLMMGGEVTGHGRSIQFSQVQVIFTADEAIFKNEIQAVDLNGPVLSNLNSVQAGGRQIERSQIIGVIAK